MLVIKQDGVFLLFGSFEPRELEMGNLVYTERTPTLKVKQHIDELEFIYLLNLLTLLHIKQRCPYAFLTKKAVGCCIKLLNHRHATAECSLQERALLSTKIS